MNMLRLARAPYLLALLVFGLSLPAVAGEVATPRDLHIVTPCRIYDSRLPGASPAGPLAPGTYSVNLPPGRCGVPTDAVAIIVSAQVVSDPFNPPPVVPPRGGYISVYQGGTTPPEAGVLSFQQGEVLAQFLSVLLGENPPPDLQVQVVTDLPGVHVVLDVLGYNGSGAPSDILLDNTSVLENQPPGVLVGNLSTQDPDIDDTHTYSLVAGTGDTDNSRFQISGSQLQTAAPPLDREAQETYSIRVRSTDTFGVTVDKVFTITATNENDAPSADNDSYNVNEGGTLSPAAPGVLDGDTDPEGSSLTAVLVSGPSNASSFTLNADGSFSYTHDGSETTSDSFTYKANDGSLDSNVATVTITINEINDAPVADDDAYNVDEGGTLSPAAPGVLDGDTDAEGSSLSAILVSGPSNASSFTLNADGSFSYTHNGSETTSDSFTYKANDGSQDSNVATVTITINSLNDAPVADNDAYNVNEGGTLNPSAPGVLDGDTDGEGSALTAVLDVGPVHASSFTLNADGSFSYTHDGSETTSDSFTYHANDGTANSNIATVTITVSAENDAPVADDDSYNVGEGGTLSQPAPGVLDGDTDAELSPLSAILVSGPSHASSFTLNADGSFSYTHDGSDTPSSDSFTYKANDGALDSNVATVTITITAANDAPVLDLDADNSGGTSGIDYAITFNDGDAAKFIEDTADATITDVDNTTLASLTVTLTNLLDSGFEVLNVDLTGFPAFSKAYDTTTDPSKGVLTITASPAQPIADFVTLLRKVTYINTDDDPDTTDRVIEFVVNDGTSNSSPAAVTTVTLAAVNDPPTADNDSYNVDEGQTLNQSAPGVLDGDQDPEGSSLTAVLVSGPSHATSFTLNADGSFSYTHDGSDTPSSDSFTYKANDGSLDSADATVTITINQINDAPAADDDSYSVDEGGTLNQPAPGVLDGDTDPEGSSLNAILVSGPSHASSFTLNANGSFTYTHDGSETPSSDSFTYKANDGSLDSNTATVTITINAVNDQPTITGIANQTIDEDTSTSALAFTIGDAETAAGTLTVSGSSSNTTIIPDANIVFGGSGASRTVTVTPAANQFGGPVTITVTVNDGSGAPNATNSTAFTVTINSVNDQPTITGIADQTIDEDTSTDALAFTIGDVETAAGSLALSGSSSDTAIIPDGNVVFGGSGASRTVTVTPAANKFGGPVTITIMVNDGSGQPNSTNSITFDVTVNSVPDPPVAGADSWTTIGNTELRVNRGAVSRPFLEDLLPANGVLANDSDPIENTAITLVGIPSCDTTGPTFGPCPTTNGGTVTLESDGTLVYVPAAGSTAADSFQYTLQNALGASANGTVNLTISNMVWYVDPDVAGPGNGTSVSPFNSLTATNVAGAGGTGDLDLAGHYIYIDDGTLTTTQTLELEANQHLIGEGEPLSFALALNDNPSAPLAGAGTKPQLTNTAADAVRITTGIPVEIIGLSLQGTGNVIDLTSAAALTGSSTLTIGNNIFRGATAEGIDINLNAGTTGTLALNITGNDWDLAGTHTGAAVHIDRLAGTVNVNFNGNTNVVSTGARGVVFSSNSAANFNVTGFSGNSVHGNTVQNGVDISNVTFDSNLVSGGIQQVDGDNLMIGAFGNPVGGSGLALGSVQGNLFFDNLQIFSASTSGTGLQISGTGGGMTFGVTPASPDGSGMSSIDADNGPAVDISSATIDLRLEKLESNTTGSGLSLSSVAGQLRAPSGSSITKASGGGTAFSVASSSATVNYAGTLNVTSGAGVSLTGNSGAMSFSGGMTLSTGTNAGFSATGGGTVTVTDPVGPGNNTITTTTGTALNVTSTTIGASGLTFERISAGTGASGPTNGIVLNTTGSSGGLTVTGTGSAGSGGTIQRTTGPGISLTSTSNVSLSWMAVQNGGDDGIRGSSVTGFTLNQSTISANGNAAGEAGIEILGLAGTASITNSTVTGSAEDNVVIRNTSGTLNPLTVTGSTFSNNSSIGGDGFLVDLTGTASVTVNVSSSNFTANRGDHFQAAAANSANLNVTFSGNTLTGGHGTPLGQGITINAATAVPGYSGAVTYTVSGNSINGAILNAIQTNLGTSASGATMVGTISNNLIGTTGSFQSCSTQGSGIGIDAHGNGTHTVLVSGNTIRQCFDRGITVLANDGSGTLNLTATGNNSSHSDGTNSREGFFLNAGSADPNIFGVADAHFVCLNLGGAGALSNTLTHGPGAPDDFRIRQRFNTTVRLPGYGGAATDTAAVVSYVLSRNSATVGSATVSSPPGGGFVGGAACPVP